MIPTSGNRAGIFTPIEDPQSRLAKVVWSTGGPLAKHGEYYRIDVNGGDLTKFSSGLAPLVVQHSHHADDVIGVVQDAWTEDAVGLALVKFARHPRAERFYSMLVDGIPLAASLGCRITEVEELPDPAGGKSEYIARRWIGDEISVCGFGGDDGAWFTPTTFAELLKLQAQRQVGRQIARRVERRLQLRADRWLTWAKNGACDQIGDEIGVAPTVLEGPLVRAVEQHLGELARDG